MTTDRDPVDLEALLVDAEGDPGKLVALLRSSGAIGPEVRAADVASQLRAALDAVDPTTAPVDVRTRARLAAIADQLDRTDGQ